MTVATANAKGLQTMALFQPLTKKNNVLWCLTQFNKPINNRQPKQIERKLVLCGKY